MWISKTLVIGIIVSLGAGAAAASIDFGRDALEGSSRVDGSAMTVPNGRVGDQVAYATFERNGSEEEWSRVGTSELRAEAIEEIVDKSTQPRLALAVVWPGGEWNIARQAGLLDIERQSDETYEIRSHVDLSTRDAISGLLRTTGTSHDLFVRDQSKNHSQISPGPVNSWALGNKTMIKILPFPYQGRTYALGDPATTEALEILQNDMLIAGRVNGDVRIEDLTFDGRVAKRAFIDGRDAYAIETNGCFRLFRMAYDKTVESPVFLHTAIDLPAHVCYKTTTWLTDALAYPVLYEERVVVNGTQSHEWLETLGAISMGDVEIPWASESVVADYRDWNPDAERSPAGQRFPADGAGLRLDYPLSVALADVTSSVGLVQFTKWKTQHSDHQLAGIELRPIGAQSETLRWTLIFATPSGQAYVLATERTGGNAAARVLERGEFASPPFGTNDFASGPVTLAAADALRRTYAIHPDTIQTANAVNWGYTFRAAGARCPLLSTCGPATGVVGQAPFYADYGVNTLLIGQISRSQPDTGVSAQLGDMETLDSWLRMITDTGNLFNSRQVDRRPGFVTLPIGEQTAPAATVAAAELPGITPPDIVRGAVITSSLLALFLIVYFLPVLKLLGTQAITIIPGYAKIQKADVLHNKVRDTMVSAIRADPGVTAPKLQKLTGAGWSTVVYHLGVLERNKMVSSILDGRHRRFFPVETMNWGDRTRIAMLKNARTKELYEAILGEPGVGFRELSHHVGISRPALYWHVDRLTKAGLVGQDKDGSKVRFYANEMGPGPAPYDAKAASEVT